MFVLENAFTFSRCQIKENATINVKKNKPTTQTKPKQGKGVIQENLCFRVVFMIASLGVCVLLILSVSTQFLLFIPFSRFLSLVLYILMLSVICMGGARGEKPLNLCACIYCVAVVKCAIPKTIQVFICK